jgi:hypothetical protein
MLYIFLIILILMAYTYGWNRGYDHRKNFEKELIDTDTNFYKNCKRQRKAGAKICQDCPFRSKIEEV